jgi:uncharacterized protein YjiS (DUF1127 family)
MIMTTSTRAIAPHDATGAEESRTGGLFDRAFRRFVAAREARARLIAYQHLANLSEERLLDLGFEPAEIRKMRAYTGTSPFHWA